MRMLSKSAFAFVVTAAFCLTCSAVPATPARAAGETKLTAGVTKKVLGSGVTVLLRESKANEIVAVQLALGMGAKFESDDEAGISRLLQQSMLKGTKTRSAEEIANEIESAGGRINVACTKETGIIQLTCTADGLAKALPVFFDVIINPTFPDEEVNKERDLQIQRIKERKDQLLASTVDLAQEVLYEKHPFHKPNEGYENTVETLGRQQVLEAYKRFYVPENMVIAAVGDFDSGKLGPEIEKMLGALKAAGKKPSVILPAVSLPDSRSRLQYKESSSAWIVMAYPVPGPSQNGYLPTQVLNSVLGGSMNSRLFTELRDKKGLGYQVGSLYAGFSRDAFVGAFIGTKPDKFEVARTGIADEVGKIRSDGITDDELASTKKYLRGTYIIELESNGSQASNLANNECTGIGYDFADRYLGGIEKVTKDEVLKSADEYFGFYALASILPQTTPIESGKTQGTEQE